jgi:dTMP kinase
MRGRFITIEGPDGSGKTTQAERLVAYLEAKGVPVLSTREPGGTWLGERLRTLLLARPDDAERTDPMTDALLFNAARRQLVSRVVGPALALGTTVVCARFADSTLAYQGHGAGASLETLRMLEAVATDGLVPDLTILLDVPAEAGLARKAPDEQTRFESDLDLRFHERVREGFLDLAARAPQRFVVVDGTRSADEVESAVRSAVARELPKGAAQAS